MAQHKTGQRRIWEGQTLTVTTQSVVINTEPYIEGIIYIDGDVTTGDWDITVEQRDPLDNVWFSRGDTFTQMTTTGGPESDGLNQKEQVAISSLGSRIRVIATPSGDPSPEILISAVFEGKT